MLKIKIFLLILLKVDLGFKGILDIFACPFSLYSNSHAHILTT